MNLVQDAWIPVIMRDGSHTHVSLIDVFKQGETIADLAANPCQRIALMRLLICVTQAALDGPADEKAWSTCLPLIQKAAQAYLSKWKDKFNLFGKDAFLQVEGAITSCLKTKGDKEDEDYIKCPNVLDVISANGGTGLSMLWDHEAQDKHYLSSDPELALNLLCKINFSCSGKVGKFIWFDQVFNASTKIAPSHAYLHTYIIGNNLIETIGFNLVPYDTVRNSVVFEEVDDKIGCPIWERMPKNSKDSAAMKNAAHTYLGRLVPLSRLVHLFINGKGTVSCISGPPPEELNMNKLPEFREPWALKGVEESYVYANAERHIWRDLETVLGGKTGALVINPFLKYYVNTKKVANVILWMGGSVKGDNEGKYDALAEWSSSVPIECFFDEFVSYRQCLEYANKIEEKLAKTMKEYNRIPIKMNGKERTTRDSKQMPTHNAKILFWGLLDREFQLIMNYVENREIDVWNRWQECVIKAAKTAYEQTCPHETPRQIQAYVRGLKVLEKSQVINTKGKHEDNPRPTE